MNDEFAPDDRYLTEFMKSSEIERPGIDVPQTILHLIPVDLELGSDGEVRQLYEWGFVVNLFEKQVPFMDLTWVDSHAGWSVDDWDQFDGLTENDKVDLGLPTGLLIVPFPIQDDDEFEREFGAGSTAETTQKLLHEQWPPASIRLDVE